MEASRFLPEAEPVSPSIVCLKEFTQNLEPVYHFRSDGDDVPLTLQRTAIDQDGTFTYRFIFYDWPFADADVHIDNNEATIDYQGPIDGLEGDARTEASRLLPGSLDYLKAAVLTDFPESKYLRDEFDRVI